MVEGGVDLEVVELRHRMDGSCRCRRKHYLFFGHSSFIVIQHHLFELIFLSGNELILLE